MLSKPGFLVRLVALRRALGYALPKVPLLDRLQASEQPFEGLFSEKGLQQVWYERGEALVGRLNGAIEANNVANAPASLAELVAATFGKAELGQVCAYALLLHNLHFAMETLRPGAGLIEAPDSTALLQSPPPPLKFGNAVPEGQLKDWIEDLFGSVAEFRTLLLNSAEGIKGDGVTWLVAQATYLELALNTPSDVTYSKLAVVNTYNAGFVDDALRLGQLTRLRQQEKAKAAVKAKREAERRDVEGEAPELTSAEQEESYRTLVRDAEDALLFADRKLVPLLAVDASMRMYLPDYGVFGKRRYLENVWGCVDWDVVMRRTPPRFKPSVVFE